MSTPEYFDIRAFSQEFLACPTCGAKPGSRCVTSTGRDTSDMHVPRWEPISIAFGEGMDEGRDFERSRS